MFESSALFVTVSLASLFATYASAADSVDNYTGTIADYTSGDVNPSLENMTIAVEVEQKGSQVGYSYTVSGKFVEDQSGKRPDVFFSLCYPTAEDEYDCAWLQVYWVPDIDPQQYINYMHRATGVTLENVNNSQYRGWYEGGGSTATHCGDRSIKADWNSDADTFVYTAQEPAGNLCDTLSMDATKQQKNLVDGTFTI